MKTEIDAQKSGEVRHRGRHMVLVPAVYIAPAAYIAAVLWLRRYWPAVAARTGISVFHPYLRSAIRQGLLAGFALFMLAVTRQTNIFSRNTVGFRKGLFTGVYLLAVSAGTILYEMVGADGFQDRGNIVYSTLYFILVGITEELIFRGITADLILRNNPDKVRMSVFLSGFLFSLYHAVNFQSADARGVLFQMVGTFLLGMLLTAIYYRTGSIRLVIFLHALNDIAAAFPVTVLQSTDKIDDIISGYGWIDILMLLPYLLVLAVLLRKEKRAEIRKMWESW